jgi:signal peptidase II
VDSAPAFVVVPGRGNGMLGSMAKDASRVPEPVDAAGSAPSAGDRRHRLGLTQWAMFLSVATLVVALDQLSKRLIDHWLQLYQSWPSEAWPVHLTHAANSGAAFSILQDQTTFLIFTSLIGLAAILLFFFYPPFEHPLLRIALGLQLGGAIGNLIDRVVYGSVTDFIAFPHYPAFNVADSSIVIGVVILVWFLIFRDDRGRQHGQ